MDLLAEGGTGVRILSPRHITADKTFTGPNNDFNTTTVLCHSYSLQPTFGNYLAALQNYATGLWISGFAIVLTIWIIYALTVRSVWRHSRNSVSSTAVVLAVFPVVASVAYVATIVPRAFLICEAIAQEAVMICLYQFYCMILADFGGVEKLVRRAGDCRLETRVLPCCCWPCCVIPQPQLEIRNLLRVRYLVLQLPVIQALIYISLLLIWSEDMVLYMNSAIYFQPFVIASIVPAIWGLNISLRAAEAAGVRPRPKLMVSQLTLLIVKLQSGIIKGLPQFTTMPCLMTIHPFVFVNLLQNGVTILEMLLLSLLAWRLYSALPAKAIEKEKVQRAVMSVEDSIDSKGCDAESKSFK